jgi:predicted CXXCH cytochrome family protein
MKRTRLLMGCSLALIGLAYPVLLFSESVVNSKHNLSAGGPGTVKAVTESQVCIFCHAPHSTSKEAPLWNRNSSGAIYTPYSSSTFSVPGQPAGASKLCLSCHDGTIALGMVRSRTEEIPFPGDGRLPPGASRLGTDLSDDHPISFQYVQHQGLNSPGSLTGPVRLDQNGHVQCTSCHDPHDDRYGKFLVQSNQAASLCTTCHVPLDWGTSVHAESIATWSGFGFDPWPHTDRASVADNACENCHRPHGAASPKRLPVYAPSEIACVVCHILGGVASSDIASEVGKLYSHPVFDTEVHEPGEDLLNPPRHVECEDCHNPHTAGNAWPNLAAALFGVRGLSAGGAPLARIDYEHELCFRCHADSPNRGPALVVRLDPQTNTRLEFATGNASYHPLLSRGMNPDVPSLISPLTVDSTIACTDCHNNDSGPGAGGSGPEGPHGSVFEGILEMETALEDGSLESPGTYALCYKCHSRGSILSDATFSAHSAHVVGKNVSCVTCHDPHGVQGVPHLVNFNAASVTPSTSDPLQRLEFGDSGSRAGYCYLTCHTEDHNPKSYPPAGP